MGGAEGRLQTGNWDAKGPGCWTHFHPRPIAYPGAGPKCNHSVQLKQLPFMMTNNMSGFLRNTQVLFLLNPAAPFEVRTHLYITDEEYETKE